MTKTLTETLCTQCGLCCDGSLFADVELAGRAESTELQAMGLVIDDDDSDGALLMQPCAALRGRRCSVYAHRPACCRTFECRLLQDVRCGAMDVERAGELIVDTLERVARVRKLMARLGQRDRSLPLQESCAEVLSEDPDPDPAVNRARAELGAAMSAVANQIQRTFLVDAGDGNASDYAQMASRTPRRPRSE
jgi:hypothetical protein